MRCFGVIACVVGLLVAPVRAAQPGPQDAGAAAAIPWPAREATVVRDVEVGPWVYRWVSPFGSGDPEADQKDAGILAEKLGVDADKIEMEGDGSVVVRMPRGEVSRTARIAGKPAAAFEVLTGESRGEAGVALDGREYQIQRTWFALYEPRGEARGAVVVLLPGMFGTPEPVIDGFVGKLRDDGWHVLRMLTHSSRFTEKREYVLEPAHAAALAGAIADELGDRAAENAMATEAVCAHIAETMPDVPIGTRVGLGMSGGGMILSTVMASEHDAYKAAVYIGAGCDFAEIAMESNYTDWIDSVRVTWDGEPTEEQRGAFREAYRAAAPLDSYSTAGAVADIPTLMLLGTVDKAVPTHLGTLLWERLGEPERWTPAATHETLFLVYLPTKFDAVLAWMDTKLPG